MSNPTLAKCRIFKNMFTLLLCNHFPFNIIYRHADELTNEFIFYGWLPCNWKWKTLSTVHPALWRIKLRRAWFSICRRRKQNGDVKIRSANTVHLTALCIWSSITVHQRRSFHESFEKNCSAPRVQRNRSTGTGWRQFLYRIVLSSVSRPVLRLN